MSIITITVGEMGMDSSGKFKHSGRYCEIAYYEKDFYLKVYTNEAQEYLKEVIQLFPTESYSKTSEMIAFHVAKLHILPRLISEGKI